jgi:hypothetical protein
VVWKEWLLQQLRFPKAAGISFEQILAGLESLRPALLSPHVAQVEPDLNYVAYQLPDYVFSVCLSIFIFLDLSA